MLRKRIKTLCGLDGYSRRSSGVIDSLIIHHDNKWYEAYESTVFTKVVQDDSEIFIKFWNGLPIDYEVVDISSYEKPF